MRHVDTGTTAPKRVTAFERSDAAGPSVRRWPARCARPRTRELAGLLVLVSAHGRRGALARCLEGLRDSAEYGADVVTIGSPAPDRSFAWIAERFPFVRVAASVETALSQSDAPEAPPRFVAAVGVHAVVDRHALRRLVRAASVAPAGGSVAPLLQGPDGALLDLPRASGSASPPEAAVVRVARRRDATGGAPGPVRLTWAVRVLVPRPDELRAPESHAMKRRSTSRERW